ncbi:PTS sugar transporter subunit IIB [Nesterenkonia sp. K-15-9-6]|uniref:PTS sugar transporter subunit IIB n=1 Tax=Nesterenkonia sp. K-15-9-6 TaxID=3093918 RepID=UPI004044652E
MEILVVCGAGASSTFVAQRARAALQRAGLPHTVRAAADSALSGDLDDVDLLLLGPQLAAFRERVQDRLDSYSMRIPLVTLPPDIFSDLDGSRTLALILESLPVDRNDPEETS